MIHPSCDLVDGMLGDGPQRSAIRDPRSAIRRVLHDKCGRQEAKMAEAPAQAHRNDPCSCGSGRKVKLCPDRPQSKRPGDPPD